MNTEINGNIMWIKPLCMCFSSYGHLLHTKKKHGYRNPSSRIEDPLLKTGQCAAQFWTSHILYLQHDAEEEGNSWYLTRLFTFCCGINAPKNLANSFSQQKNCWLDVHSHHSPRWEHLALTYIFTDQFFPTENRAPNTRGTRWEFATSNGYHLSTMDGSNPEDDPLLME